MPQVCQLECQRFFCFACAPGDELDRVVANGELLLKPLRNSCFGMHIYMLNDHPMVNGKGLVKGFEAPRLSLWPRLGGRVE